MSSKNVKRSDFNDLKCLLLFVGFPRSGHSFIGQILNAHKDVLIGNEGRIFDDLGRRFTLLKIYDYLAELDNKFAIQNYCKKNGQDFLFKGLSQGNVQRLICLGNTKAAYTRNILLEKPAILKRLQEIVPNKCEVKFIMVLRDPRDMVGSKIKRRNMSFETAFQQISEACQKVDSLLPNLRAEFDLFEIVYENFILNLHDGINDLFDFLNLQIDSKFLNIIQEKTYTKPQKTREYYEDYSIAPDLFKDLCEKYSFLKHYRE
jgi:hypothetical protein